MPSKESIIRWLWVSLRYIFIFITLTTIIMLITKYFNLDWLGLTYVVVLGFAIMFGLPAILIYKFTSNSTQKFLFAVLSLLAVTTLLSLLSVITDTPILFWLPPIIMVAIITLYSIYKFSSGKTQKFLYFLLTPPLVSLIAEPIFGKEISNNILRWSSTIYAFFVIIFGLYYAAIALRHTYSKIIFNSQNNNDLASSNISPDTTNYNKGHANESKLTTTSTIKGKHVYGLSTAYDKTVEVFLYDDKLVFMDGSHEIETIKFDDYIEVEARYKEAVVGSTTTANRGIGLASTVAALKGDWLAAIALSPNTTTYTTRPDIVSYWALWIESTGLYVIQIDSESKLRKFVDSCNAAIDAYQASQLLKEEPGKPLYNLTTDTSLPQQPQTQSTTKSAKISINKMTGIEFEEFCTKLLSKNGFINVIHTGGPNDQGADIVATKDSIKYAFQCKCYSSPLGNTPVQEALAGKQFRKCHIGVVITNSTFTKGAKELADSTQIILWDNTKLRELLYNTDLKDKYNL